MSRRVSSRAIIGREEELAALDRLLADTSDGRPGVAVIAGEAGVGKSRLATALEERARALGFTVLHGESIEFGGEGFAYAPVASALRDLPPDWTQEALRAATPEVRAALAALLPDFGETDQGQLSAGSAHGRRCVILTDLLGRLADERAPVLIVLEDVHWADRSSREYLAYLSRNVRDRRIACAVTFRTGELAADHPWRRLLAELSRRPAVTSLDLPPLTAVEVGRQLEAIAGEPVDQGVVDDLHTRAGGNPFLVEELFAARRGGEADAIPATLADAALVRVQGLDEGTRRILAIVAVAGRIDHGVLARVASPADPRPALRRGLEAGLLVRDRDDRGVAFRHGLMGEVLYGHLLPDERAALHRAIARALSAGGDAPASQLAHHWHRAGEHADALAASVTAGLVASRMFAFAEAQAHLERALDLWQTVASEPGTLPLDHVELLSRAAQAARFSGDRERAIALGRRALDEFDASVDPARAARLFERLGEAHFWDDETALEWYGKALVLLPRGPSPERARLLAAEGHALMGLRRWAEARARCEQALEISSEADAGALTTLGLVLAFLGEPVEGEAHLRRALERARSSGSADDVARAYINLGELLRLRGEHAGALEVMVEGDAFATRVGMRGSFGQFMFVNGADDLLRLGRWDDVRERLGQAERMSLGLTSEAMYRAIAAQLHALRGDGDIARRHLDRAIAVAAGLPSEFVTPIRTAGATLALVERDPAGARRHVDAGLSELDERDPLYTPPLITSGIRAEAELAQLARARRRRADADRAVSRAERLAADADRIVAARPAAPPDALAHQALAHAEVARADEEPAVERWASAAEQFLDLGEPHPAAYAQFRQAEALLAARGERREAARLLAAADQTALALGAAPLRADIAILARRARLKLEAPAPDHARADGAGAGLTTREEEVLRLLADGLTNREIGRRLFISQKTVGTHVAHIFDKLDVHTRLEAAGRAQQLGVLERSR